MNHININDGENNSDVSVAMNLRPGSVAMAMKLLAGRLKNLINNGKVKVVKSLATETCLCINWLRKKLN